jgi:hypothetical protein
MAYTVIYIFQSHRDRISSVISTRNWTGETAALRTAQRLTMSSKWLYEGSVMGRDGRSVDADKRLTGEQGVSPTVAFDAFLKSARRADESAAVEMACERAILSSLPQGDHVRKALLKRKWQAGERR